MTQLSSKLLCLSLVSALGILAACNQAPVRPTTVNLNRNGDDKDATPGKSKGPGDTKTPKDDPQDEADPVEPDQPDEPMKDEPMEPEKPVEPKEPEKPVEPEKPKEPTVAELFTEAQFNQMLPHRIPFYTYKGFIDAAEATPRFAKEGTVEARKREIAAMLANARHESDEFRATREYNMAVWGHYCMPSAEYPCASGQTYQGRGPIQLSWNYNYKDAGKALGIDLLNNPDLVATDPKVAFQTLMWFWMERGDIKCHDAIINKKGGFAQTIRTINGGLECTPANDNDLVRKQREKRVTNYQETLAAFGLTIGSESTNCIEPYKDQ